MGHNCPVSGGTGIPIGSPFATASGGSLTLNSDGSYSYTPPAQKSVPPGGLVEVFNYTIADADGDSASATLTITVTPLIFPDVFESEPEAEEVEPETEPAKEANQTEPELDNEEVLPDAGPPTAVVPEFFAPSNLEPRRFQQDRGAVAAVSIDLLESEDQSLETLRLDLQKRAVEEFDAIQQLKATQRMMDALDRVRDELIEESQTVPCRSA